MKLIDYLINSGSSNREFLEETFGEDFYDNHWDDFVTAVSSSTKLNSTNTLTDSERQICEFENPLLLITDKKIKSKSFKYEYYTIKFTGP